MNSRLVCRGVAKHPKGSAHQIGNALLFAVFARGGPRIDRQKWRIVTEGPIDERGAVISQSGPAAHLVGDAFDGLLDGVEVIVDKDLGPTEFQYVWMNAPSFQIGP